MNAARREWRGGVKQPRMLVGVDGSVASIHALRWALAEKARTCAGIEAVYVYAVPAASGWSIDPVDAKPLPPARAAVVGCAQRELDRAVRRAVGDDHLSSLSTLVVLDASAASGLARLATTAQALVVGGRRDAMGQRVLGSTATALLEAAACPVLVVSEESGLAGDARADVLVPVGASSNSWAREC